jgi:uncharacterized membrane protein
MLPARSALRWFLAIAYLVAGVFHLARPDPFVRITPVWVPDAPLVIALTGLAEIAGALALAQGWSLPLRRAAGWGLALYALCVWPANFNHFLIDCAREGGGLGLGYHLPRLAAQPLIIWAAAWASGGTDWPFARRLAKARA